MTSTQNNLLRDPLFQLNAVLWLAQPLPDKGEITPLFYARGFSVYAIAPLLTVPIDLRLRAQEANMDMSEGARPDLVLAKEIEGRFAFFECKAASFGTASSTARQGRALLVIAGPRSPEVLGLESSQVSTSLLTFMIAEDQRQLLAQTGNQLQAELDHAKIPNAQLSILGMELSETELGLVIDSVGSTVFAIPEGLHCFVKREAATDPRPLYFIPYDPDIDQSPKERAFCKRVLFERMHATVVAAVGRASPPSELVIESGKLLNDALFGMYDHWENSEAKKHMRGLCREFMDALMKSVNSAVVSTMTHEPSEGWKVTLSGAQQHEKVIDALCAFSCETLDLKASLQSSFLDDS